MAGPRRPPGGTGLRRTGAALAGLAVLDSAPGDRAVTYAREQYERQADWRRGSGATSTASITGGSALIRLEAIDIATDRVAGMPPMPS
ncbi:hypothetical protein ACWC5I_04885 [Kitasatospora sp. NPDC001574]